MTRLKQLSKLILVASVLYIVFLIYDQLHFENQLKSVSITFKDFPPDYERALKESVTDQHPLAYDDYATFEQFESNNTIPRTIHFIWFENLYDGNKTGSKIPSEGSKAPEWCRKSSDAAHANFTINVWNATAARELLETNYEWFLPTYDNYRYPIQRVDALKYFVLWHFGGVYMDLDIRCLEKVPMVPLFQFSAWFPKTSLLGVNNDLMAARPRHPVIGEMTRTLKARNVNLLSPYLTVYFSTGPQFASDVLKRWMRRHKKEYASGSTQKSADRDDCFILPQIFYAKRYKFFGHLKGGGTWHDADVAVVNWLVGHVSVVVLIVSPILITSVLMCLRRREFKLKYSRRRSCPNIESRPLLERDIEPRVRLLDYDADNL